MESLIFLQNTSLCPVHGNVSIRDDEFEQKVRAIIATNDMSAKLYPAVWCENSEEVINGVLVELSYIFPSSLIKMAQILKDETGQEQVLINTASEFAPPSFTMTKKVTCPMTDAPSDEVSGSSGNLDAAVDEYCSAQKEFRAKHYFNPAAAIYKTDNGIRLFSVARLEVDYNFDYWQKMMGKFLGSLKKRAVFHFTKTSTI